MRLQEHGLRALLIVALATAGAQGQGTATWVGPTSNNNWTTTSNWSNPEWFGVPLLPDGSFDETAVIDNGSTALINSDLNSASSRPGDLFVSNNSKLDITGSGAYRVAVGTQVTGAASFAGGGTLSLTGAAASFHSNGLSLAGGGVYSPVITSASHGLISVNGDLALSGGTIRPSFSSFSPTVPQSWVLADATNIVGSPVVDASAANLAFGRRLEGVVLNGGANGRLLRLDLKAVLGLTVNADTGAASISSPTGSAITITGYGISSSTGQLKPAGWSTLTTQLGGGWNIAGTPSTTHLDELGGPIPPGNTTQASLAVNATARSLGSPFNPASLSFGTAPSVGFKYVTSAGEVVAGDVQLTGLNSVNNLLLTVDPTSGQARLTNSSMTTIQLRGYSILSASSSLKPANGSWNSLQDQGMVGVEEANPTASHLSELIPLAANSITLTPGQNLNLGGLFNAAGTRDLQLSFQYSTAGAGDFNGDGSVNQSDLTTWKAQYGSSLSGADFLAWQRNLGSTSGSGPITRSGVVKYATLASTPVAAGVPEPAGLALVLAFATVLPALRKRAVPAVARLR